LPTFVICQEFIDALPVYVCEKTGEGWRERLVDVAVRDEMLDDNQQDEINDKAANKGPTQYTQDPQDNSASSSTAAAGGRPRLRLVVAPEVTPPLRILLKADEQGCLPHEVDASESDASPVGSVIEVNPEGLLLVQDIARLIDKQGGGALIVDYGQEGSTDSIRSFYRHEQVHFLTRPGEVDVTADVDFAALKHAVQQSKVDSVQAWGPQTQGEFLMAMGVQERVLHAIEQDGTSDEQAEDLYEAMVRLCAPEEMGQRFKVLALTKKASSSKPPPGFSSR
jgi:NADH dehydrogenase [ubiquinone] 1 alpha subcomplex assembly factor 7